MLIQLMSSFPSSVRKRYRNKPIITHQHYHFTTTYRHLRSKRMKTHVTDVLAVTLTRVPATPTVIRCSDGERQIPLPVLIARDDEPLLSAAGRPITPSHDDISTRLLDQGPLH